MELEYCTCIADRGGIGKVTSFPSTVKMKLEESVVSPESAEHGDLITAKTMKAHAGSLTGSEATPFDAEANVSRRVRDLVCGCSEYRGSTKRHRHSPGRALMD